MSKCRQVHFSHCKCKVTSFIHETKRQMFKTNDATEFKWDEARKKGTILYLPSLIQRTFGEINRSENCYPNYLEYKYIYVAIYVKKIIIYFEILYMINFLTLLAYD